MAAYAYMPEDWASMMQSVRDWAQANTPSGWTAVFGKQVVAEAGAPQPPKPFVYVQVIVPPVQTSHADQSPLLYPGTAVVVGQVAENTAYVVGVNSSEATYVSGAAATEESIVDGLVASVSALGEPVEVSKLSGLLGSNAFALNIRGVADEPALTTSPELFLKMVSASEKDGTATFQIDVVGRDQPEAADQPGPLYESVAVSSGLQMSLDTDEVQEEFRVNGWSIITVEGERKPDQVAGTAWEDRAGFDLRLRCRMRDLRVADFIESVEVGSGVQGNAGDRVVG